MTDAYVNQIEFQTEGGAVESTHDIQDIDHDEFARVDGAYEQMTVGNAEQLVSTVGITDEVPYNFRTSGGTADIGDREEDEIVGGTIAWNQIAKELIEGNYNKGSGTAVYDNGTVSFTAGVRYGALYGLTLSPLVNGHKYLINSDIKLTNVVGANTVRVAIGHTGYGQGAVYIPSTSPVNTFINVSGVVQYNPGTNPTFNYLFLQDNRAEASQIDMKNLMLIDLTQMFGSTIADYIYSLEQANAGAGVAWFKKLFPKPYYAYNAGELLSVNTSAHNTVGFNAWDEEWEVGGINTTTGADWAVSDRIRTKGFIPVLPSTSYFMQAPAKINLVFYDVEKAIISTVYYYPADRTAFTTPPNCRYMRFATQPAYGTTYNHDICINLSWDGERDGEYEPYVKHEYALDSSLILRGIPKLDSANELYYDGDTYKADGAVTRWIKLDNLGTFPWTYNGSMFSAYITDLSEESTRLKGVCEVYPVYNGSVADAPDKSLIFSNTDKLVYIKDSAYTDVDSLKTAMSGKYVAYKLATPTTEEAEPFASPQIVSDWGTEEYVDYAEAQGERDVAIPVGHNTYYQANLRAKVEMAPNSPDGDGDYIVRQTNGTNEYVPLVIPTELPTAPSEDGTYRLAVTVTNGTPTYSWVSA